MQFWPHNTVAEGARRRKGNNNNNNNNNNSVSVIAV
jgi:hypothetical protein